MSIIAMLAATLVLTGAYSLTGCGDTPSKDTAASTEIATETSEATEAVESTETVPVETESAYNFTDMEAATMYAKSTVNVRDLPSTDGNRLGSLSKNQEVTVTGQCNETGWYRIAWENGTACASSKYLSKDKTVEPEKTGNTGNTGADTTMPIVIEIELIPDETLAVEPAPASTVAEPYFDRAMAEEICGHS